MTGEWRKLHNDELNDLYTSPNTGRVKKIQNEMDGECSTHEGKEKHIQCFGGET